MRNKLTSEHLCCCIALITIEDSDCDTVCWGVTQCSVIDGFVHSEKPAETMSFFGVINLVLASSSDFKSILVCDR
jgi:hypothetical protein